MSKPVQIAITVASPFWRTALPAAKAIARRAAQAALKAAPAALAERAEGAERVELSLVLAEDELVQGLNRDYRGKDKPTNVLSFPGNATGSPGAETPLLMLGDVILAYETIAAEAAAQGKAVADHLAHLVVHGVLHLLGFDHEGPGEAELMEGLEVRALAQLKISDPYTLAEPARSAAGGGR